MNEATLLESRLSKVEQDNRRLKLTLGALLLALAAVPLIGAVMPEQIPQVIRARSFEVENGQFTAVMNHLGLRVRQHGGNIDRMAGIAPYGLYYRDHGTNRATMGIGGFIGGVEVPVQVALYDDDGNVIWSAVGR